MAMTPTALLFLLLAGAGGDPTDLASLIDPAAYFQARDIKVSAEKMAELAVVLPTDGKTQFQALLAIRWLGRHTDEARKAGAVAVLQTVRSERKVDDPHGFLSSYAARALAQIQSKPLPHLPPLPAGSVRDDALAWFPADVHLVAVGDLRAAGEFAPKHFDELVATIFDAMPPSDKKAVFDFVDQVGNIHLDRMALALRFDARKAETEQIFVRFTGKFDHRRLASFLKMHIAQQEERKGPRGEPITLLHEADHAPALALIGDTDVVLAGYQQNKAKHTELVDRVLAVRAGKQAAVGSGTLADLLKKIPDQASAMFAAELPEEIRKNAPPGFPPLPPRLLVQATRTKTVNIQALAVMKDDKEAEQLAKQLGEVKEMALKALDDLPPFVKAIPGAADVLRKPLSEARVEAESATVEARIAITEGMVELGMNVLRSLTKRMPPR